MTDWRPKWPKSWGINYRRGRPVSVPSQSKDVCPESTVGADLCVRPESRGQPRRVAPTVTENGYDKF